MDRTDRQLLRGIRRQAAIASNNLRAYRMVSRTQPPKKGKGASYKRTPKHKDSIE